MSADLRELAAAIAGLGAAMRQARRLLAELEAADQARRPIVLAPCGQPTAAGPSMACTLPAGHAGEHRCRAADVDARRGTKRD